MPKPADDASTDIDKSFAVFKKALESCCAELHKKDPKFPDKITVVISPNRKSSFRTPKQQAAEIITNNSQVCWGAHMSDKARHVLLKIDGKGYSGLKEAKPLKDHVKEFKEGWTRAMAKAGVLNHKGKAGWGEGDEFHLELPDGKIARTSERAGVCMEEYVKMTRKDGKKQNATFEKSNKAWIDKIIARLKLPAAK